MSSLNWNNFKPKFGTWADRFQPLFASGKMDPVYAHLKSLKDIEEVIPKSNNLYRAFRECNFKDLQCVIIGDVPYDIISLDGPIDSGVWLDSSLPARTQQKLLNFYKGIEVELYNGLNLDYIQEWDLSYLSSQGILMIPCSLTRSDKNTHYDLWKPFIEHLLINIVKDCRVPVLFIGKEAHKYSWIANDTCPTFELESIPDNIGGVWDTKNVFKNISECVELNNDEIIMWLNTEVPF